MNTNDDPRLTAYALGEMSDAERAAFEAELAADTEAREAVDAEVAAIRSIAGTLTGELKAEIEATSASSPSPRRLASEQGRNARATTARPRVARWVIAAAASVVVGGLAFSVLMPSPNRARETSVSLKQRVEDRRRGPESELQTNRSLAVSGPAAAPGVHPSPALSSERSKFYGVQRDNVMTAPAKPAITVAGSAANAALPQPFDAQDSILLPIADDDIADNGSVARTKDQARQRGIADSAARTDLRWADAATRAEPPVAASTESYAQIHDNSFLNPRTAPLSTFGIDVDTASYANVRRFLESGQRPPAEAVRVEELINYFPTRDAPPTDGRPFAVHMEVAACPWTPEHRLVRVALKGQVIARDQRPPSNLVFLIDVSGSMNQPNKLPLVKRSLRKLVGQLGENDRVAIVVYAGSSGLVLPSTPASDKAAILKAIDNLEAGGSTNGGQGIELAYATAMPRSLEDRIGPAGSSRVILCTDGDFNVGITDRNALFNLIAEKAKAGVFLNVLGFGTGNIKDDTMEGLADKGNGQYGYIDSDREADKVFVEQVGGTLQTIAKDVKLQLEFNPATVRSYRLIGYENRVMAAKDFNNDLKDSGDLGAGHGVVALYEIEPAHPEDPSGPVLVEPALKYQPRAEPPAPVAAPALNGTELLTLKLRYKKPDAPLEQGTSELIETTLSDRADASIGSASDDLRFAAAVAQFGMLLRESPHRGSGTWESVRSLARSALGDDAGGHRTEFLNLIDAAQKVRP